MAGLSMTVAMSHPDPMPKGFPMPRILLARALRRALRPKGLIGLALAAVLGALTLADASLPRLPEAVADIAGTSGMSQTLRQVDMFAGGVRVTDGDTLRLNGTTMRLHGIDAPESNQACARAGQRYGCGREATRALRALVAKGPVRCAARDTDRYGRTIAVCYVDTPSGQFDANAAMVEAGWALAYRRYSTDYVAEENRARANNRGMWAGTFTAPWDWRRQQ